MKSRIQRGPNPSELLNITAKLSDFLFQYASSSTDEQTQKDIKAVLNAGDFEKFALAIDRIAKKKSQEQAPFGPADVRSVKNLSTSDPKLSLEQIIGQAIAQMKAYKSKPIDEQQAYWPPLAEETRNHLLSYLRGGDDQIRKSQLVYVLGAPDLLDFMNAMTSIVSGAEHQIKYPLSVLVHFLFLGKDETPGYYEQFIPHLQESFGL